MEQYENLQGNSGVLAYEIGIDYIKIRFREGTYLYTYEKPGSFFVEQMKLQAKNGKGLCTFINKYVRENYKLKL